MDEIITQKPTETKPDAYEELVKIAKKQLLWQRISTSCIALLLVVVITTVSKLIPQVETTLGNYNDVAVKVQESLKEVDEMTDEMVKASENLNKLVDENADELTAAVKSISEIDFEGLNQAITDLKNAVGPLANVLKVFR